MGKIKIVILKISNYFANIKDRNKCKGVTDIIYILNARVSSIWLRYIFSDKKYVRENFIQFCSDLLQYERYENKKHEPLLW